MRLGPYELLLMIPILLFSLAIYMLPTIIAAFRRHPNLLAIVLVNFFAGWTGVGWIVALVWSFSSH